jgi:hypothetical protein
VHARRHVDERAARPDREFSAASLLSFAGMIEAKYSRTRSSCSRRPGVHVHEHDALLLEVLAHLVVDDLGLVLRADAGEELALGLGMPSLSNVRLMSSGTSSHVREDFSDARTK